MERDPGSIFYTRDNIVLYRQNGKWITTMKSKTSAQEPPLVRNQCVSYKIS